MPEKKPSFYQELCSDSPLHIVVKGSLAIEKEMDVIIHNCTISALAIRRAKFKNHHKINLVIAFGLDERFHEPLQKLSNLRNKIAHELDYEVCREKTLVLYNAFSDEDKKIMHTSYKKTNRTGILPNNPTTLDSLDLLRICIVTLHGALKAAAMQTAA